MHNVSYSLTGFKIIPTKNFSLLLKCESREEMLLKEKELIRFYNSLENGTFLYVITSSSGLFSASNHSS